MSLRKKIKKSIDSMLPSMYKVEKNTSLSTQKSLSKNIKTEKTLWLRNLNRRDSEPYESIFFKLCIKYFIWSHWKSVFQELNILKTHVQFEIKRMKFITSTP